MEKGDSIIVHIEGNIIRIEFDEENQFAFGTPNNIIFKIIKKNDGYEMKEIKKKKVTA